MRLLLTLFVLVLFGGIAFGESADAPSPAPRIVIAPAKTEIAKELKAQLRSARDAGSVNALDLYYFYGSRGFEPLWLSDDAGDGWNFAARTTDLLALFRDAGDWGLDPKAYTITQLAPTTLAEAAKAELATTAVALQFGMDNYGGRVDPRSISPNLDMGQLRPDIPALLDQLAISDEPAKLLADLAPDDPEFSALLLALRNIDDIVALPAIEEGPSIKPGATDDRVPKIRQRLGLDEVGAADGAIYDDALVNAIEAFQSRMGLVADGVVGDVTREALNRSGQITREQLLVNLEKWRWLPRQRGDFRVEVNIPEFRLWIRREGEIVHETRVVVGTPANQTPIFYDQIRHVVVNPYWNVPVSIARNEIGPQVRRDPGYLARREFELLNAGSVIDPWSVDWSSVASGTFPFSVRQKPGSLNALGQVKFLFPNKHDVYLHDTPEKSLFGRDVRAYSHGCVRVENPFDFADALLANEPSFGRDDLVESFGSRERWFNMEVKVPVYLTYLTVRADEDGSLRSFADVYGHDSRIAAALKDGGGL